MMKLSEIRKAYEELSSKLSDINRQLCFAGFAVIWIFNKTEGNLSVPKDLYLPALFLVGSLFLDLLQYLTSIIVWYFYYLKNRKTGIDEDIIDVNEPEKLNFLPWFCYLLKIIFLVVGYIFIGKFLILYL